MGEKLALPSANTRLLGVLGHPVGHSLSPTIHNTALRAQSIDAVYLAFDVIPERLPAAIDALRSLNLWGANITIPHKERVTELVDKMDPTAERVGAINTIVNRDGYLTGHNTDVAGFLGALRAVRKQGAEGARCLVVGAGGAGRAVVAALMTGGAESVSIYNRTPERAQALCEAASAWGAASCAVVDATDLGDATSSAEVVINATSVGLTGSVKNSAIPVDSLGSHQVVVDLVYGHQDTALVSQAISRGATAIGGLEMLLRQAAASYELWTGQRAPLDVMRASVVRPVG